MFFRRKPPTLESLDARVTALELALVGQRSDETTAPSEGPQPVGSVLAKALESYEWEWKADQKRRGL